MQNNDNTDINKNQITEFFLRIFSKQTCRYEKHLLQGIAHSPRENQALTINDKNDLGLEKSHMYQNLRECL